MTQGFSRLTEVAIRIAREAGLIALEGFRNSELQVHTKRDFTDVVTEYDRACEAHIRESILAAYPVRRSWARKTGRRPARDH